MMRRVLLLGLALGAAVTLQGCGSEAPVRPTPAPTPAPGSPPRPTTIAPTLPSTTPRPVPTATPTASMTEFCSPDAKKCLAPSKGMCDMDPQACSGDRVFSIC